MVPGIQLETCLCVYIYLYKPIGPIHSFIHSILIQFVRVNENCVQYIIASYIVWMDFVWFEIFRIFGALFENEN